MMEMELERIKCPKHELSHIIIRMEYSRPTRYLGCERFKVKFLPGLPITQPGLTLPR